VILNSHFAFAYGRIGRESSFMRKDGGIKYHMITAGRVYKLLRFTWGDRQDSGRFGQNLVN
jgi:hypothetical protein